MRTAPRVRVANLESYGSRPSVAEVRHFINNVKIAKIFLDMQGVQK